MAQTFKRLPAGLLNRLAGEPVVIEGRTLDKVAQVFWNQGQKQEPNYAVDTQRAGIKIGADLLSAKAPAMASIEDRSVDAGRHELAIRIFKPRSVPENAPVMLWFHQGGFVIGGIDCTDSMCAHFAEGTDCIVVSGSYRLAPEHKFPAQLRDGETIFAWLAENAANLGANPQKIIVGGESAGGFIAAHLAQYANNNADLPKAFAQLLVYPWLQADEETSSYTHFENAYPLGKPMLDWFGQLALENQDQRQDPEASPGKAENLEGLSPAFIHPAGFDPLTQEAEDYANRLKEAGVDVTFKRFDSLTHSFLIMTGAIPAAMTALNEICEELRTFLKNQ